MLVESALAAYHGKVLDFSKPCKYLIPKVKSRSLSPNLTFPRLNMADKRPLSRRCASFKKVMVHCGRTSVGLTLYRHAPDINSRINISSKDPSRLC